MKKWHLILSAAFVAVSAHADPLRVYVRGGVANRGEEVHAHTRFAREWPAVLTGRGMKVEGGLEIPTDEQLARTDVIVMYAQEGGTVPPSRWAAFDEYLKRGGGLVVLHTAAISNQVEHWKAITGSAWRPGAARWREGPMDLYYVENQKLGGGHPITKDASNFHLDDEIYYDIEVSPEAKVLATSYTPKVPGGRKQAEGGKPHIYDIQPQMWTIERTMEGGTQPYRALVSIPGHYYKTLALPHYRAIIMRGIAWAGKRPNLDEFCKPEELSSLTYPEGGPQKPADTLKNLEIHPDFNMTLVTAEPLITKPMNFDWAPDGSMWVAETPEYPNGRRGMRPDYRGKEWKDRGGIDPAPGKQDRPGLDKISRLIDTDKDGVMDKKEVFYEGLDLVTGLVFHKDGVIVTQAPDILWLRDTDKDGKADKVEKLYGNLGTGDTHAVINNPRWGWDGWIYATHGYSGSGNVVNAKGGKQDNIGSGVVRFKPDGSKMEQYSSKGGNTWGLQITGDNRVMWTQPTSGTILEHVVLPEYALARGKWGNTPSFNVVIGSPKTWPLVPWEQLAYVQIDFVGSFTATAGCAIYDGGSWPEEYNGDYFTTEPTINIIHHARLTPKGSSYEGRKLPGREETEFVRSKDMWWRPIETRIGPDGALYVGDFYNQAVIHNDTRGPDHNNVNAAVRPDRDHYFGRIWRIDHKQAKKIAVPDLSNADAAALVKALEHPNRHVRMNASRLLVEKNTGGSEVVNLVKNGVTNTKIAALWTSLQQESLPAKLLTETSADADAAVRRNAMNVAEVINEAGGKGLQPLGEGRGSGSGAGTEGKRAMIMDNKVTDDDAGVRLAALRSLAANEMLGPQTTERLVLAWGKFDDDFQKSAAVGALAKESALSIAVILDTGDASLAQLASILTQSIGDKNDTAAAAKLVIALADKPASSDGLKRGILDTLAKSLKAAPEMSAEVTAAFTKLLSSGAAGSALPLAAQWDKTGVLKDAMAGITKELFAKLTSAGASDDDRFTAASSLIGLRSANGDAIPAVLGLVTDDSSPALKTRLINALGETGDTVIGAPLAASFGKLPAEAQTVAFNTLLKRADWSLALLDAVKAKSVDPTVLGPANIHRLRTHPDKAVAKRANEMMDDLMPGAKAKAEVIAKLVPEVEKKGNIENGKLLFTATCATCHKFGNSGMEVGPNLTGMGAHGAGELLAAIVDPNAEVDPSFTAWNVETKDGQTLAGVIARENPANLFLKFQGGEKEVKTAGIKSRTNTGRSLMPEGFEALGPEVLRDIIAYMQATDGGKFRTVDLRPAFTTTTALGIYEKQEFKDQTLTFTKTGTVPVNGVPFNIVGPEKAPNNILVLKGGAPHAYCYTLPQKVDIKAGGYKANRIHFLGGVTGWGWQPGGAEMDVLKVTIHTTQGQRESLVFKSGVEFSDYYNRWDVPGSKFVPGVVRDHQIRTFSRTLNLGAVEIDRITLESVPSGGAPTIVGITLEMAEGAQPDAPALEKKTALEWKGTGPKVLLVGGGSSHDFEKWFHEADVALLSPVSTVAYTKEAAATIAGLAEAKVAVLSVNDPAWATPEVRKALFDFVNAGDRGLVLLHAGLWYNFRDWPEYNKVLAGGGSRGHDRLGDFPVTVKKPEHPVFKGVAPNFTSFDELYWWEPAVGGSEIEVLATAPSPAKGKEFPMVFTVAVPKCRTIAITLGHDARMHVENANFRQLLTNAVTWAAGK